MVEVYISHTFAKQRIPVFRRRMSVLFVRLQCNISNFVNVYFQDGGVNIEIHWNRTENKLIAYKDGVSFCSFSGDPHPCVRELRVLAGIEEDTNVVLLPLRSLNISQVRISIHRQFTIYSYSQVNFPVFGNMQTSLLP